MKRFSKILLVLAILISGVGFSFAEAEITPDLQEFYSPPRVDPPPPRYTPPAPPKINRPGTAKRYGPPTPPTEPPLPSLKEPFKPKTNSGVELQELQGKFLMPVLPERLRRNRSIARPFTRTIYRAPHRQYQNESPLPYVQRQPKRPAPIYVPKLPSTSADWRGSRSRKNFSPPRAAFRK